MRNLLQLLSGMLVLTALSCRPEPSLRVVTYGLSSGNALRLEATIVSQVPAEVYLAVWRAGNSDTIYTPVSSVAHEHEITAIGLLPETAYRFKAVARNDRGILESPAMPFTTGSLPESVPEFRLENRNTAFDGFILGKRYFGQGCFYLLDDSARVIWYEAFDGELMRAFSLTGENTILSLQDSSDVLEFDWYGNRHNAFRLEGPTKENRFHHALIKYRDGNVLGLNYDYMHPDLRKYGGLAYDTIRTDGLLLSAPDGRHLWQWSTFDVAQPWNDPQLMSVKHDWGHANSIDQDDEGNLIVSYRDFDQVWKVDPRDGRLIWKLGRSGDFDLSPDQVFLRQHDAHFDDAGNLILFDNGGNERPTTRIISFLVDDENMRVDTNWSFEIDQELHTRRMGSADLIDERRVLVCSPKKQLFLAVYTVDGVEIWRVWASHDSLRAIYVPASAIRPAKPF